MIVRSTANAAILNSHNEVLLVRRPMTAHRGPGQWQIPGGKLEQGETPLQAVQREVREELQLNLKPEQFTFVMTYHSSVPWNPSEPFDIHLFVCHTDFIPILNDESDLYEWVPLDDREAFDRPFLGITKELFDSVRTAVQ